MTFQTPARSFFIVPVIALMMSAAPFAAHAEIPGTVVPKETKQVVITEPKWETETVYWSDNYSSRPYYKKTTTYTTYEPAYKYGYEAYSTYEGVPFDKIDQAKLQADWERAHDHNVTWDDAYPAIRDSYTRVYEYHHTPDHKTVVIESEE